MHMWLHSLHSLERPGQKAANSVLQIAAQIIMLRPPWASLWRRHAPTSVGFSAKPCGVRGVMGRSAGSGQSPRSRASCDGSARRSPRSCRRQPLQDKPCHTQTQTRTQHCCHLLSLQLASEWQLISTPAADTADTMHEGFTDSTWINMASRNTGDCRTTSTSMP